MNAPRVGRIAIQTCHEQYLSFWDFDQFELDLVAGVVRWERCGLNEFRQLSEVTSLAVQLQGRGFAHLINPYEPLRRA